MEIFRKGPPVTLSLIIGGIFAGIFFLAATDNPWQDFRWISVLIGIFIGLGVTALEKVQFRKKRQEEFSVSKMLHITAGVIYITLYNVFLQFPSPEREFFLAQLIMILCIYLLTLAFCFKVYEFRVGYHGITWKDIV